jgi:hypothetical protein
LTLPVGRLSSSHDLLTGNVSWNIDSWIIKPPRNRRPSPSISLSCLRLGYYPWPRLGVSRYLWHVYGTEPSFSLPLPRKSRPMAGSTGQNRDTAYSLGTFCSGKWKYSTLRLTEILSGAQWVGAIAGIFFAARLLSRVGSDKVIQWTLSNTVSLCG